VSRPVIVILSSKWNQSRGDNDTAGNTWLKHGPGLVPLVFILGAGAHAKCNDELVLNVPDGINGLAAKCKAALKWALRQGYSHVFCCSTDTHRNPHCVLTADAGPRSSKIRCRGSLEPLIIRYLPCWQHGPRKLCIGPFRRYRLVTVRRFALFVSFAVVLLLHFL
jgi:hypothetical protein